MNNKSFVAKAEFLDKMCIKEQTNVQDKINKKQFPGLKVVVRKDK